MTPEERQSAVNGIWLCQTCSHLVDRDLAGHTSDGLRDWKQVAEAMALLELKGWRAVPDRRRLLRTLEMDMPDLFAEMRNDLKDYPVCREFFLLDRAWVFGVDPTNPVFQYYFDDHVALKQKMRILEGNGLVQDVSYQQVDKFRLTEEFVEYLKSDLE